MEETKIPTLMLGGNNEIIEQTMELPLLVNDKEIIIKLRKLSTGERNRIQGECSKTKILNGQPNIVIDSSEIQEKILSKAIVEAPFNKDVEGIKKLPPPVSDYLYAEYQEFAEPSSKKKD